MPAHDVIASLVARIHALINWWQAWALSGCAVALGTRMRVPYAPWRHHVGPPPPPQCSWSSANAGGEPVQHIDGCAVHASCTERLHARDVPCAACVGLLCTSQERRRTRPSSARARSRPAAVTRLQAHVRAREAPRRIGIRSAGLPQGLRVLPRGVRSAMPRRARCCRAQPADARARARRAPGLPAGVDTRTHVCWRAAVACIGGKQERTRTCADERNACRSAPAGAAACVRRARQRAAAAWCAGSQRHSASPTTHAARCASLARVGRHVERPCAPPRRTQRCQRAARRAPRLLLLLLVPYQQRSPEVGPSHLSSRAALESSAARRESTRLCRPVGPATQSWSIRASTQACRACRPLRQQQAALEAAHRCMRSA
jgi:hypothetical protein